MAIMQAALAFTARPLARSTMLALAAAGASALLLLGALGFEHLGGLRPCALCHWQRWAHVGVVVLGLTAASQGNRPALQRALLGLVVAALLGSAALAGWHAGIEWKLWTGPESCTGSLPAGLSVDELRRRLLGTAVQRCDEIPWSLLGLSMAGWNAVLSLLLALGLGFGALRAGRPAA